MMRFESFHSGELFLEDLLTIKESNDKPVLKTVGTQTVYSAGVEDKASKMFLFN